MPLATAPLSREMVPLICDQRCCWDSLSLISSHLNVPSYQDMTYGWRWFMLQHDFIHPSILTDLISCHCLYVRYIVRCSRQQSRLECVSDSGQKRRCLAAPEMCTLLQETVLGTLVFSANMFHVITLFKSTT